MSRALGEIATAVDVYTAIYDKILPKMFSVLCLWYLYSVLENFLFCYCQCFVCGRWLTKLTIWRCHLQKQKKVLNKFSFSKWNNPQIDELRRHINTHKIYRVCLNNSTTAYTSDVFLVLVQKYVSIKRVPTWLGVFFSSSFVSICSVKLLLYT